jgi:hypothetical protein
LEALDRPKHLVLAMPNVPMGKLSEGIRELWAAFARLRRMPIWKLVRGAVAALEVTLNEGARSWHPHLHIILDAPYLPWDKLMSAWKQASGAKEGESRTCWIRAADAAAVRELVKYVTKMASFVRNPQALEEFLLATKRVRFLRSYGSLYGLKRVLDLGGCPDCGLKGEKMPLILQAQNVAMDASGILRPSLYLRAPPGQPMPRWLQDRCEVCMDWKDLTLETERGELRLCEQCAAKVQSLLAREASGVSREVPR